MHPAKSVIAFTTLSGAGYGLLFILIVGELLGLYSASTITGLVGFGIAFIMVTVGLLSSTFHLGHPEQYADRLRLLIHGHEKFLSSQHSYFPCYRYRSCQDQVRIRAVVKQW